MRGTCGHPWFRGPDTSATIATPVAMLWLFRAIKGHPLGMCWALTIPLYISDIIRRIICSIACPITEVYAFDLVENFSNIWHNLEHEDPAAQSYRGTGCKESCKQFCYERDAQKILFNANCACIKYSTITFLFFSRGMVSLA